MTELLKGNSIAKQLYGEFVRKTGELRDAGLFANIAVVIATDDPAVETYTSMIAKNCAKAGITAEVVRLPEGASTADVIERIGMIGEDEKIHGVIVMLPLWKNIDEKKVLSSVPPQKDIDGVSPVNAGKLVMGEDTMAPNTAQACMDILTGSGFELKGKNVVIVGRSNIVGKPLANMLVQKGVDATVTLCHSKTIDLKKICRQADILVAAIGSPLFITKDFTNSDQIVVDVGMNEVPDGSGGTKLVGDVDFENVKDSVKAITPVPGGVSPLTHTALIKNVLKAISLQINEQSGNKVV
jgi:methylenetetrahydrofolate dehydrogenase (NADP+) / methenyltetrahydrofolate cyclohydrolase